MRNKKLQIEKERQADNSVFSPDRRDVIVYLLLILAHIVALALAAIFQILWLLSIALVAFIVLLVFAAKTYKKYKQKFGKVYTKRVTKNLLIIIPVYIVTSILIRIIL